MDSVTFGLPGGLSAKSLVHYAHAVYHMKDWTLEQSIKLRDTWINEVYPEMAQYLSEDILSILSRNLCCSQKRIMEKFDWTNSGNIGIIYAVRKIVKGETLKKDGTPYTQFFIDKTWESLEYLCNNEYILDLFNKRKSITDEKEYEVIRKEIEKQLFWDRCLSDTGRLRGKVNFSQSKNSPFQGLAADGAKLALWKLTQTNKKIVGFIHDEVLVLVKDYGGYALKEEIDDVVNIMVIEMGGVTGKVPIGCDYGVGKKWKKEMKIKEDNNRLYPIN